jgi:hypothetical protein
MPQVFAHVGPLAGREPFVVPVVQGDVSQATHPTSPSPAALTDELDPELCALPAPPKARRIVAMSVMALTVAASLTLLATLVEDIRYFFAPSIADELGEVTQVEAAALTPNSFVRVQGTPMASGMVHYHRMFSGSYAVFPLAGQRAIFVQVPLDGADAGRHLARREYAGRLVTFGQLGGRFREVRQYLDGRMEMPVSSETFLLLADESPRAYGWSLPLAGMCVLFVLVNMWLMWRWFRPTRVTA